MTCRYQRYPRAVAIGCKECNCKVTFINRTSYPYGKRSQFQTRGGIAFAVVYKPNTSQDSDPYNPDVGGRSVSEEFP